MKLVASILFVLMIQLSWTQDSISVLFIGNSYLSVNNLPQMAQDLTESLGDHMLMDSKMNGGFTFQSHAFDATTYNKIHSKPWDFVVLQGQSQEPSFPFDQVSQQTLPYAQQISDSVYASNQCSQVNYYMTWGRQVGDPQWDSINTFDKMNTRLRNAYLRIADSTNASVSPVGVAWKYVRDNYPSINLYAGDGSHPSLEGSYLAACTFYSSLFQKSCVGASYTAGLNPQTCAILQLVASSIVLDSIPTWKLVHHDSLFNASFVAGVNDYDVLFAATTSSPGNLVWDFGDGSQVGFGQNPTHTYTQGTYTVTLFASGACGMDTVQQQITVNTVALEDITTETPCFYQNENGEMVCQTKFFEVRNIEAINFSGQRIPSLQHFNSDGIITFVQNPDVFMIRIEFDNYLLIQRLH
jgi:PKD repeat protein